MITLEMTPKQFAELREMIEDRFTRASGKESETLKRVLEAFKNAESEESKLKVEMTLEDAEMLEQSLKAIEEELVRTVELIKKLSS